MRRLCREGPALPPPPSGVGQALPALSAAAASLESRELFRSAHIPSSLGSNPAAELGLPSALTLLHSPWRWSGNKVCSRQQM